MRAPGPVVRSHFNVDADIYVGVAFNVNVNVNAGLGGLL